jgi:hypothetical protein
LWLKELSRNVGRPKGYAALGLKIACKATMRVSELQTKTLEKGGDGGLKIDGMLREEEVCAVEP